MKDTVERVDIKQKPIVKIRVIDKNDSVFETKSKKKYPFELFNDVEIVIEYTDLEFNFYIPKGYIWNGADIPKTLFLFGQSKDNNYLVASMVHDYMLEHRQYIFKEILHKLLTPNEYRRLTSLVFRQILKDEKTNVIKANIMAWCVDVFQATVQRKQWSELNG